MENCFRSNNTHKMFVSKKISFLFQSQLRCDKKRDTFFFPNIFSFHYKFIEFKLNRNSTSRWKNEHYCDTQTCFLLASSILSVNPAIFWPHLTIFYCKLKVVAIKPSSINTFCSTSLPLPFSQDKRQIFSSLKLSLYAVCVVAEEWI